jgi:hypothetical protein
VYAASFGLVILALITLIIGVFQSGLTMIWVSIGSSVLAALFLAVGVLQKKPVQPATAGAPYGPPPGSSDVADDRETAVIETPARRRVAASAVATADSEDEEAAADEAPAVRSRSTARKPAARKTAPKKAPAKTAPSKAAAKGAPAKSAAKKSAASGGSTGGQVVAIPERGTYHQASCRFVRGRRDTERLTRASAGKKGYTACGVCRP